MKNSYLQQANKLKKSGNLEAAIAFYQQAVEENPTFYYSHYNLGESLAKIGRLEEAIVAYQHAIEINPNSVWSYSNIGDVFFELGQWKEALLSYYRVLELTSNSYIFYHKLGEVLYHISTQINQDNIQEFLEKNQELLTIVDRLDLTKNDVLSLSYLDDESFLEETNKLNDGQFVEKVYRTYLNREADEAGKNNYVYLLSEKMTRKELLAAFRNSEEFATRLIESMRATELYKLDDLVFLRQTEQLSDEIIVKVAMSFQTKLVEIKQLTKLGLKFFLSDFVVNIGHIALIDIYIKQGILGWRSANHIVILATENEITNQCFLKYWSPYITVVSDPVLINSLLPLATYLRERVGFQCCKGEWMYHSQVGGLVQRQWEKENRSPLLTLSAQDYDQVWECLHDLGLPKNRWFVTLHVREWSSKGYAPSRRADINTYLLAIKSITSLGGWVVRIGDQNMPPLPKIPQVIDLAHSHLNNELMNVFVLSQCRFLLGMPSASYFVALTFGVPCVLTNWSQLGFRPWSSRDIFIPKLFLNKARNSFLNFSETIKQIGFIEQISHLDSLGIKQIDNTSEEINDVVLEMLERLNGELNYTPEDERLQQKFDAIAELHESYGSGRVGRSFLRKYAYLLAGGESS